MIYTCHQILVRCSNQWQWDEQSIWHVYRAVEKYEQDLESKKDHLKDQDIDRQQETLTWILKKQGWRAWKWTSSFHKMRGISCLSNNLLLKKDSTAWTFSYSISQSLTFGGTLMLTSNIWPACDESIRHRSCSSKLSHCHSLSAESLGSFCKHSATKRPDYNDTNRRVYSTGGHPCFNAFFLISVSCWIKIYCCQGNQGHEK